MLLNIGVYWFSMATVTNYHKLGGLKQQKFILSVLEAISQQDYTACSVVSDSLRPCGP